MIVVDASVLYHALAENDLLDVAVRARLNSTRLAEALKVPLLTRDRRLAGAPGPECEFEVI